MELSKIPKAAWLFISVAFTCVFGGFIVLSVMHVDTTDFYRFLNVLLNIGGFIVGAGGAALAGQAAKQTDGVLHDRIKEAVAETLNDRLPGATPVTPVANKWTRPPADHPGDEWKD